MELHSLSPLHPVSLPKDLLSLTPWVGPCGPSRRRSPFAPIAPDSGPSFCRAAPESPMVGRRTPLPHSSSFSLKPLPGGAVRPGCEENHERSRKGVSLWSAPSSNLGPPSLVAAPLYISLPHYKCSCSSAVDQSPGEGSEYKLLGSSPKDLIQGVTQVGPGNLTF